MARDRIDRHESNGSKACNGISALSDWAKNEWSTVAGAAHGLASVPGVVSNAWRDAAKTNEHLAAGIANTLNGWDHNTATGRQAAINHLTRVAQPVSKIASAVALELSQANRSSLAFQTVGDLTLHKLNGARSSLHDNAGNVSSANGKLPAAVETHARDAVHALRLAASSQAAKASGWLPTASRSVGNVLGAADTAINGKGVASNALSKVPFLHQIPGIGLLLTAQALVSDVRGGKSVADAAIANVGGTVAGTAAGSAVTTALTSWVGAAGIADVTAEALGVAAATGPVGWAVAGGVLAGAAIGYGVYKTVESKPGQEIIDGVSRLDIHKVELGFADARADAGGMIETLSHITATRFAAEKQ